MKIVEGIKAMSGGKAPCPDGMITDLCNRYLGFVSSILLEIFQLPNRVKSFPTSFVSVRTIFMPRSKDPKALRHVTGQSFLCPIVIIKCSRKS